VSQPVTDLEKQEEIRQRGELPSHVAIIMDGNGRWARQKGKPRALGHRAGVDSVRDVTEACAELGIRYLTLYTFSTENWNRPSHEVDALMSLLIKSLEREAATLHDNDIRLVSIGDRDALPPAARERLDSVCDATKENAAMTLVLALSYSGRWEILQAARSFAFEVEAGRKNATNLDQAMFQSCLSDPGLPDPDLLIRTGGEKRVSNFLLWQLAYTELYFSDAFWPDFRRTHLYEAIEDFQDRDRRFGRVENAG